MFFLLKKVYKLYVQVVPVRVKILLVAFLLIFIFQHFNFSQTILCMVGGHGQ
jgi:hypothetical protein